MTRPVLLLSYRPIQRLRPAGCMRTYASNSNPAATSAPTISGGPQAPLEYCSSLVQKMDPEAWLCSYFWPKREKAWWLAWRAFNLELHSISTTVSQPALASIRFQFWRDTLKGIFASNSQNQNIPQHPVAVLLANMKRHRPVQKYYLSQLIDVRAKALSLPPAAASLESHLSIHSPLSTSLLLGPLPILLPPTHASSAHISHTLSHVSTLLTVVSLLRNLPILISQKRQISLPADICEKYGIIEEELFRKGAEAKGFRDACWEIGTRGMDELITARRDLKETGGKVMPNSVMPIFLSAVPPENYLKRLEKYDFDVFHPELQKHDWRLAPKIWYKYQTGKL
ncbi:hypothetical protein I315_04610 [Cryptococcus gattii Ru294]|uniref:Phytoene synthase n=2 Tax=Cryptococcus gattii TaxID=37769 RepID=E6RF42_CRYGW|nr:Hypothetical protein CGB_M1080C [Cryptococcus gattii WM276]KIR52747.1 hypothetical protein I315_04610 [Cryptococcus gattii Ru294]KIR78853.1 hypothetical protein I306_04063 [Cryptococcus gattii EJB2]KIY32959.1 hypothetical protein I305_04712 [Cryptococcus gattii E566]KJE04977.1 hypothetical protein I311_01070 [Cryptococcus gattii NT-10]ADV25501.1 Hypothetical protein CGB_M1080C [Cryptococcus gattii WM276]